VTETSTIEGSRDNTLPRVDVIFAQRGTDRFLVGHEPLGWGRIYDARSGEWSYALPIQGALARGYWRDPPSDAELPDMPPIPESIGS
jgi:hypothetical protein